MKPKPQGPRNVLPTLEAEERAGIAEFDGALTRDEAERLAMDEHKAKESNVWELYR
jgi:hypothetical protein